MADQTEASTAEASKDEAGAAGGTTPSWWEWVRRHRRPVRLVAGLVVVGLAATLVLVVSLTPGPKDVVQDYLDAIRAGDTETALEIAGEPEDDERLTFLTEEALADDWTVDAVVERHRRDDEADVDITISVGDSSEQGRFHMVRGDDGWRMESPFVKVDLMAVNWISAELGDTSYILERATDMQSGVLPLLVFPGVYELYPSLAKWVTFERPMLIATPQGSEEATLRFTTDYTLTDAGADAAQQAVNRYIDVCATKEDIAPNGCPFNAEDSDAVKDLDVPGDDITWTIVSYPEAQFRAGADGGLAGDLRKPGTVKLTGTGFPEEPNDSTRTAFATTCEFGLSGLTIEMERDGFIVGHNPHNSSAELATVCF